MPAAGFGGGPAAATGGGVEPPAVGVPAGPVGEADVLGGGAFGSTATPGGGLCGIELRSASTSCASEPSRTCVSSIFSRTTRSSPDRPSISSRESAVVLRVVADCSSSLVVTVFNASTSVPIDCCSWRFCSCSIRISAIICWCSLLAAPAGAAADDDGQRDAGDERRQAVAGDRRIRLACLTSSNLAVLTWR